MLDRKKIRADVEALIRKHWVSDLTGGSMTTKDTRIGQGFEIATTDTLLAIRENFFHGLDKVVEHMDKGTLHVIAEKRASSPGETGRNILEMCIRLDEELAHRENRERGQTSCEQDL